MKKTLLLWTAASGFFEKDLDILKKKYILFIRPKINKKETIKILKNKNFKVWVVDTCPNFKIDEEILNNCPNLSILASPATGSTHIDREYIKLKKIKYISIKDRQVIRKIYSSSEHAFALLLASVRNIRPGLNSAFSGNWRDHENSLRTFEVSEKNLGLIGYGRIGKNLSKYALAFGINVGFYDPFKHTKNKKIKKFKSIIDLYKWANIVSIQVHLNKDTKNLLNEDLITSSKTPKTIINISRGEIVDEKSVIKNIKNGMILKYATDVVSDEQDYKKIKKNPIIRFGKKDNRVIVTPHTGGLTFDSEKKAAIDIISQLIKLKL